MARPIHEMTSWGHSVHHSRLPDEEWMATRELTQIQTKLMRSQEDYLANGAARDIGRRVSDDRHELFVVCDPAEAMVQQLEHLQPELIAVHDLATDSSRRLVAGLAAATGKQVQKLVIRRQGHGQPLATLEFAELAGANGQTLRVYSTIVDASTEQRHLLTMTMLAHARLAVVMVGDLPPHALDTALEPLREGITGGPWPNRNMIMVPLGASSALVDAAARIRGHQLVNIRVTPQATKPNDAWSFISLAWDRLRSSGNINPPPETAYGSKERSVDFGPTVNNATDLLPVAPPPRVAKPLPMQPMPAVPRRQPVAEPMPEDTSPETMMRRYLRDVLALRGMVSCCVFDLGTQRTLAHAGGRPGPATLATKGGDFYDALVELARGLGLAGGQPEATVTLSGHHILLRPVPGHPGLMLHAVLDANVSDLPSVQGMLARFHPGLGTSAQAA